MKLFFVVLLLMSPGWAWADSWSSDRFDQAFNAAARKAGVSMILQKVSCDADRDCRFSLGPDIRAEARGGAELHEVAFYIPATADKAQRRRATLETARILQVLISEFDSRPAAQRQTTVSTLLDEATGPQRRSERRLAHGVVVLSATQADNFRVYLTR